MMLTINVNGGGCINLCYRRTLFNLLLQSIFDGMFSKKVSLPQKQKTLESLNYQGFAFLFCDPAGNTLLALIFTEFHLNNS